MRGDAGGSYQAALRTTFFAELLSMNVLMAGMVPTMMLAMKHVAGAHDPAGPAFWFVMSMALLVGFVAAYPMNWWLVSRHLKHGMMTVRAAEADNTPAHDAGHARHSASHASDHANHASVESNSGAHGMTPSEAEKVSHAMMTGMTVLSMALFALGIGVTVLFGGFS
jgi:hypothetical protein